MLDNGKCFSKEGEYYKDFLKPRTNNDLRDYLRLGLVPKIPGIYGKEKLEDVCLEDFEDIGKYMVKTDLMSYEEYIEKNGSPYLDAVFLSHAHLDHLHNITFMAPEIPIYCSEITKKLLTIISDLSNDNFLEYSYAVRKLRSDRSSFPGSIYKKKEYRKREIKIIDPNTSIEISKENRDFIIHGFPVDHSLPGAMAFKITTNSGKNIIYTGDIRFHGHEHEKENSLNFINNVGQNPDVLITEGTRIDDEYEFTEEDVYNNFITSIKDDLKLSERLILVSFPWKCLSRFLTVHKIATALNRTLVIQPKLAYTIHHLQNFELLNVKEILKKENLKIYLPRKTSMIYSNDDYKTTKIQISFGVKWTDDLTSLLYSTEYGEDIFVRACEIKKNPGDYILHLNFYELNELIDICPPELSYFFNLNTEPFDEEGEIEEKILSNWISRFNLKYSERFHASGHASAIQLKEMINKIKPRKIFPIHTEKPELFNFKNAEIDIIGGYEYHI